MLLPGYALMAQGTQIHIAAWPFAVHAKSLLLSRAFAAQGACYVIATRALFAPDDVQQVYRDLARSRISEWALGDSQTGCKIIDPRGDVIAQAPAGEETILTASVSLEAVLRSKAYIDVGGHYSRPDVLQLLVNRRPLERVVELSSDNQSMVPIDEHVARQDSAGVIEHE